MLWFSQNVRAVKWGGESGARVSTQALQSPLDYFYFFPLFHFSKQIAQAPAKRSIHPPLPPAGISASPRPGYLHRRANLFGLSCDFPATSSVRSQNAVSGHGKAPAEQGRLSKQTQVSFFFSTQELPLRRASGVTVPGCFGCPVQCSAAGMEPWSPDRACPPPVSQPLPGVPATRHSTSGPPWCQGLNLPGRVGLKEGKLPLLVTWIWDGKCFLLPAVLLTVAAVGQLCSRTHRCFLSCLILQPR